MTNKIFTQIKQRRDTRKKMVYINGVNVPHDRRLWTDDLEREIAIYRARF